MYGSTVRQKKVAVGELEAAVSGGSTVFNK